MLNLIFINNNVYESLPEAYQQAIDEVIAEVVMISSQESAEFGKSKLQELKDAGLEIIDLPQSELDRMRSAGEVVYDMVREEVGNEIVNTLLNALDKK